MMERNAQMRRAWGQDGRVMGPLDLPIGRAVDRGRLVQLLGESPGVLRGRG